MKINADEVDKTFRECLFRDDEILKGGKNPDNAIVVEGIVSNFGFHPERLKEKHDKVKNWLKELPDAFHKSKGGGWSFLNACNDKDGNQWTGLHQRMEQLLCLGIGLNLAGLLMNDMRDIMPGGMPYFFVDVN